MPITPPAGSRAATDPDSVLLNLTRAEIEKILHYVHPIPVGKGFTREFLLREHPGWQLKDLMAHFTEADIIEGHAMTRFNVKPRVAGFIVYSSKDREVVWMTDEEWDAHLAQQQAAHPLQREGGGRVLIPGSQLDLSSEAGVAKAAQQIADQLLGDTPPPSRHRRRRQG
jgi:hypothetical protein